MGGLWAQMKLRADSLGCSFFVGVAQVPRSSGALSLGPDTLVQSDPSPQPLIHNLMVAFVAARHDVNFVIWVHLR